jgi:hypothetical protein
MLHFPKMFSVLNGTAELVRGHIAESPFCLIFQDARVAEEWPPARLLHEYWICHDACEWEKAAMGIPGAEPVTVGYW